MKKMIHLKLLFFVFYFAKLQASGSQNNQFRNIHDKTVDALLHLNSTEIFYIRWKIYLKSSPNTSPTLTGI